MSATTDRLPDPVRSRLRLAVDAVERALPPPSAVPATGALEAAWRELVDLLALGPEPTYRQCPTCGRIGMRAATVCGHCWTRLSPA